MAGTRGCGGTGGAVPPYDYQPGISVEGMSRDSATGSGQVLVARVPCQPDSEPRPQEFEEICPAAPLGQPPCSVKIETMPDARIGMTRISPASDGAPPRYMAEVPVLSAGRHPSYVAHVACMPETVGCRLFACWHGWLDGVRGLHDVLIEPPGDAPPCSRQESGAPLLLKGDQFVISFHQVRYLLDGAGLSLIHAVVVDQASREVMLHIMVRGAGRSWSWSARREDGLHAQAALSRDLSRLYLMRSVLPPGEDLRQYYGSVLEWDQEAGRWMGLAAVAPDLGEADYTSVGGVTRDGIMGAWCTRSTESTSWSRQESPDCSEAGDHSGIYDIGTGSQEAYAWRGWDLDAGRMVRLSHGYAGYVISGGDYELVTERLFSRNRGRHTGKYSSWNLGTPPPDYEGELERIRDSSSWWDHADSGRELAAGGASVEEWRGSRIEGEALATYSLTTADGAVLHAEASYRARTGHVTAGVSPGILTEAGTVEEESAPGCSLDETSSGSGWWCGFRSWPYVPTAPSDRIPQCKAMLVRETETWKRIVFPHAVAGGLVTRVYRAHDRESGRTVTGMLYRGLDGHDRWKVSGHDPFCHRDVTDKSLQFCYFRG